MVKILINCSTCVTGGGVQASSNIITESLGNNDFTYYYLLSKEVDQYLIAQGYDVQNRYVLKNSPASFIHRNKIQKTISALIHELGINLVFTTFGPAYLQFKCPHLMGFADPWVTHPNRFAYSTLTLKGKVYRYFLSVYKRYFLLRENYIWVETEYVKRQILKLSSFKSKPNIFVVPNTVNSIYFDKDLIENRNLSSTIEIFVLSAYYPHKNLELIIPLTKELIKRGKSFKFYVTQKENSPFMKMVKSSSLLNKFIINCGELTPKQCLHYYNKSSLVFLPTLLENFSAVYIESKLVGKPLLTTNFDFAKDVLESNVFFFEPMNHISAADQIEAITNQDSFVSVSNNLSSSFIDPNHRFKIFLGIFNKILN